MHEVTLFRSIYIPITPQILVVLDCERAITDRAVRKRQGIIHHRIHSGQKEIRNVNGPRTEDNWNNRLYNAEYKEMLYITDTLLAVQVSVSI